MSVVVVAGVGMTPCVKPSAGRPYTQLGAEAARAALEDAAIDHARCILRVVNERIPDAERVPMAIRLFGGTGYEYQQRFGASDELFAQVRVKASRHAEHNTRAIFRKPLTEAEVLASPKLFLNMTRLETCPPSCGGAAAVRAELTWQLRGSADKRQVEDARLALQHNIGLGGACVVTLYERAW